MGKKVLYYSKDKLYKMKKKKNKKRKKINVMPLYIFATVFLILISIILFQLSVTFSSKEPYVMYNEIGKVDYKVYLKDNDYYESSFLESGMQYVANLIKTINVKFNYELHTTEDLNFNNEYNVVSELQITERNDSSRVLYSKKDYLVPVKKLSKQDDNLVINEEIDIDYDKYNNIVNDFKKDLGLIVSSNLILTLETKTKANNEDDKLVKNNELQIVIPLSESTLKINMNVDKINNSDTINASKENFNIKNPILFTITILTTIASIGSIILVVYLYVKHMEKNPYKSKINNILKNYDRLIVTGNVNLDESKYSNIIYPETFKEVVDAAQNFGVPIMHYEVIKNEKSIFIVTKDDTLIKYRVTKAYLNNKKNKDEDMSIN